MSTNLAENVKTCLNKLNVRKLYVWSDSTTVIHWLKDNGEYKTFVSNKVSKIKGESYIEWKYVPTKENPAILGIEVVKYVSMTMNGEKVLNGSSIKHNGLNNQKLRISRNLT